MRILFYDFNIPYLLEDSSAAVGGATVQAEKWMIGLSEEQQKVGVLIDGYSEIEKLPAIYDFVPTFDLKKGVPLLNWLYYRLPELNKELKKYNADYVYHACAGFTSWAITAIASR